MAVYDMKMEEKFEERYCSGERWQSVCLHARSTGTELSDFDKQYVLFAVLTDSGFLSQSIDSAEDIMSDVSKTGRMLASYGYAEDVSYSDIPSGVRSAIGGLAASDMFESFSDCRDYYTWSLEAAKKSLHVFYGEVYQNREYMSEDTIEKLGDGYGSYVKGLEEDAALKKHQDNNFAFDYTKESADAKPAETSKYVDKSEDFSYNDDKNDNDFGDS